MAATTICVPSPTLTSSSVSTSQSVFTTTTLSTSTLPEELSTTLVTFTTCTPTNSTSICVPTSSSSIITLPANTTTLTVAVTSTSDVLSTSFTTLFGSSCVTSEISTPGKETSTPTSTPTSAPISTPTNSINTNTSSSSSSISSTTTSSSGAPADTGSGATIQHDNKGGSGGGTNVGPIVGGVVGGVAALIIVGFITWKLIKKQSRFDDIFNTDRKPHYQKKSSIRIPEPKPYDYGLVGSHAAPTSHSSHPNSFTPPSSPPPTQGTFNNIGPDPFAGPSGSYHPVPGQDIGPQLQPNPQANVPNVNHLRNPSLAPLLAGVGVAVGAGAGVAAAVPSRPSSTASTSTSPGPLVTNAIPGQSPAFISNTIPPNSTTYPPAMQNWSSNQTHTGGSSSVNTQGYGPGPSMSGPSSSLSHNPSANSSLSMYTTPPGIVPLPVGAASASRPQQQQQQYEDPFARTGSPVSFQENRVLQVRNATRSDSLRTTGRASGVRESGIYDPNAYYLAGSTPSTTAAGASSSSAAANTTTGITAAGASSSRNEKQQLVHLDGSLFQERPPGTPAPPAYAE